MQYLALIVTAILVALFFLVERDKAHTRQKTRSLHDTRVEELAAGPTQTEDKRNNQRKLGPFKDVTLYDPVSQETTPALLYDIAVGGVGLLAEHLLPRGRELVLTMDGQPIKMLVRSCARKNNRWVVGCEFTEPLPEPMAHSLGLSLASDAVSIAERR